MIWLDPRECLAARDALARGNPSEAAQLLLASKSPQHRAVRRLLEETAEHLVRQARQHLQGGELESAEATLALAARCMPLKPDALALQRQVAEGLSLQRQQQAWQAAQLEHARTCINQGQFQTACEVLKSVDSHPQASLLLKQVAQKLETFRRLVQASQQALRDGESAVAYRYWQQAKALAPADPELVALSTTIAQTLSARGTACSHVVPVRQRTQPFLIDDLALVISTGEVVLGTRRAEGVQVPILGPVHGRHTVLLRDRQGWQLIPCRDRHGQACPVGVAGRLVADACRLADGCLIQLGGPECLWQFRLPLPGSLTAVLELMPGRPPCVVAGSKLLGRVVLLDDELRIRPVLPAHLVLRELPSHQFVLRWQPEGLGWEITGGTVCVERPGPALDQPTPLLALPSRLILTAQLDEAEWLGREVAGCAAAHQLVLTFADPAAAGR